MQEIKIPDGCKASIDFEKRVVVIEDDKPKFKRGDIVISDEWIILINRIGTDGEVHDFASLDTETGNIYTINTQGSHTVYISEVKRLATSSEAQLLFDALAKKGKKWNPETMQIEDIENTILVPKDISIYKRKIGDSGNYGDGLFIGFNSGQRLGVKRSKYNVDVDGFGLYEKVQCKLTPCERKDLKVGDTAFTTCRKVFHLEMDYCKVLDGCFAYIDDMGISVGKWNNTSLNWYKVEPLNI